MEIEGREIPAEFARARSEFHHKSPKARPYNVFMADTPVDRVDSVDLSRLSSTAPESLDLMYFSKGGHVDCMITNAVHGYAVRDVSRKEGYKVVLDRLVVNLTNRRKAGEILKLFLNSVCSGSISFSNFRGGGYGAVGFSPKTVERAYPDLCIKYFNFAFPYSEQRWKASVGRKKYEDDTTGKEWNLSGVTGLGNYIALRHLGENGIPVPEVYLGSSEILIQENIEGYTIAQIIDDYEKLQRSGVLEKDDRIIDGVWDFAFDSIPKIAIAAKKIIDPIKDRYWSPSFQHYDINWGNVMIKKNGLHDPENNYVVIDPLI